MLCKIVFDCLNRPDRLRVFPYERFQFFLIVSIVLIELSPIQAVVVVPDVRVVPGRLGGVSTHPYPAAAILDLKRGWTGIEIAKMAHDHCCVPLCSNDKRYDSGKDLSYFDFPSDKQKRKCTPSYEYNTNMLFTLFQPHWRLLDKGVYTGA